VADDDTQADAPEPDSSGSDTAETPEVDADQPAAQQQPAPAGSATTFPGWLSGALVVVLALVIGGVGFAIGRSTAPDDSGTLTPIASQSPDSGAGGTGGDEGERRLPRMPGFPGEGRLPRFPGAPGFPGGPCLPHGHPGDDRGDDHGGPGERRVDRERRCEEPNDDGDQDGSDDSGSEEPEQGGPNGDGTTLGTS
jgi:hypothetical protein